MDSLKQVLSTSASINDTVLHSLYVDLSYYENNPELKIEYSNKAHDLALKNKNNAWVAAALSTRSRGYMAVGNLDKAIVDLLKCKEIYDQINNQIGIALVMTNLGNIYKRNGEYFLSEECYLAAIEGFKNLNDKSRFAVANLNLGELYRICGYTLKAIKYFNISRSAYSKLNDDSGVAYSLGNIGLGFSKTDNLDSAQAYLNKSISILEPLNDNYAISSYMDGLAEVYFKQKKYNKALDTAIESLLLAQEYGLKEQIRDASLRMSDIYNQLGDYKKAYDFHKQYVAYRDSINNEETIRKIANLRTKYEVAQKQKEIDEQKAKTEYYFTIVVAAVVLIGLFIILVVIMLNNSRSRRRINKVLVEQRKELVRANATKNKYFSVLSHDLRGSLATFNSYAEIIELCIMSKETDKLDELSDDLSSSSANLLNLLDNLLQWGVSQMGTADLVPANVSMKDVVLMEISHLKDVAHKKEIEVLANVPANITLYVDRVVMAMAIRNLINNALKFTPSGGKVWIEAGNYNGTTFLKISDSGVGMTEEQQENLFDFNKINSTYGTQNEKGVGLGLQLVLDFVKHSKAEVKVDSEVGEGTSFTFTFVKENPIVHLN